MERNVSMDEISDGRLYGLNDMVKACLLYTSYKKPWRKKGKMIFQCWFFL